MRVHVERRHRQLSSERFDFYPSLLRSASILIARRVQSASRSDPSSDQNTCAPEKRGIEVESFRGELSMTTFDVDSHVEESVETWKYLEERFARRRPVPITLEDQPAL